MPVLEDLPGADVVLAGVRDAQRGETTIPSLLVAIAAPRLRQLGLDVPGDFGTPDAEIRLYEQIGETGALDPYGEYNALLRRLTSFTRALEQLGVSRPGGAEP